MPLLREMGISILREREPNDALRELKANENLVVAFAALPGKPKIEQPGNALPEDLMAVFESGKRLAREYAGIVDAWEMVGEPDVGYCIDLPDRVVAYQKALYLGIKAGAAELRGSPGHTTFNSQLSTERAPLVLMGALALPPGPWLHRAVQNGLLDYTDAYNFHFYGHAEDLTGVIAAHRAATREREMSDDDHVASENSRSGLRPPASGFSAQLPLWITECGINAVTATDFLNPERRELQAEFTLSTAQQALTAPDVAVFMPFILVGKDIPQALTLSPTQLLPAWHAYTRFTREHPWPKRPLARPEFSPNPVVVQWLPDNATTVPHKMSGTYRFRGQQLIRGELRAYNFSTDVVHGNLQSAGASHVACQIGAEGELTLQPMSVTKIPVTFAPLNNGYFRDDWSAEFVDTQGRKSPVAFGLEVWPRAWLFEKHALEIESTGITGAKHRFDPRDTTTSHGTVWQGVNGIIVDDSGEQGMRALGQGAGSSGSGVITNNLQPITDPASLRVWVENPARDPLRAKTAVAKVHGLPSTGFIHLQLDRPMDRDFHVCVDLLDNQGQRFTIWENFGLSYFDPYATEVWLNLRDFQVYFWGHCTEHPDFRPEQIEEIQLRFYIAKANDPRRVSLSLMTPR